MRNWNILLIVFISSLAAAKRKQVRLIDGLIGYGSYHLSAPGRRVKCSGILCTYSLTNLTIHHTHLQAPFFTFINFASPKHLSSQAHHINKSEPHTIPTHHPSHRPSFPNRTTPDPLQTIYRFHSIYRGPCGTCLRN